MPRRFENFSHSISRHGLHNTFLRWLYRQTNRLFEFEWCRVETSSMAPYNWPPPSGCETRSVDANEFFDRLCPELKDTKVHWAFARGDQCTANFVNGEIVGYSFTTTLPTRVREGLTFTFPADHNYVFAAITASNHRGKKLARERWKVGRETRRASTGVDNPRVWYINAINLESRAAGRRSGGASVLQGYTGYIRLFGRWYTYRSPAARHFGAGFASADDTIDE